MVEALYEAVGFFMTLIILLVGFGMFIFWIAGLAGMSQIPDSKNRSLKLTIGVLFPPYPFCWLIYDIYRQYKLMQEDL